MRQKVQPPTSQIAASCQGPYLCAVRVDLLGGSSWSESTVFIVGEGGLEESLDERGLDGFSKVDAEVAVDPACVRAGLLLPDDVATAALGFSGPGGARGREVAPARDKESTDIGAALELTSWEFRLSSGGGLDPVHVLAIAEIEEEVFRLGRG